MPRGSRGSQRAGPYSGGRHTAPASVGEQQQQQPQHQQQQQAPSGAFERLEIRPPGASTTSRRRGSPAVATLEHGEDIPTARTTATTTGRGNGSSGSGGSRKGGRGASGRGRGGGACGRDPASTAGGTVPRTLSELTAELAASLSASSGDVKDDSKRPASASASVSSSSSNDRALCVVCFEPLSFVAIGLCGHDHTCALCTARRRVLYNELDCAVCKEPLSGVVIVSVDGTTPDEARDAGKALLIEHGVRPVLEQLPAGKGRGKKKGLAASAASATVGVPRSGSPLLLFEPLLGILYNPQDVVVASHVQHLRRETLPVCPLCSDTQVKDLASLRAHLRKEHKLNFCSVCLEFRKVFLHEQKVYGNTELRGHMRDGDIDPPVKHVFCQFCNRYFYDVDAIFDHMEKTHFRCHVCDKLAQQETEVSNSRPPPPSDGEIPANSVQGPESRTVAQKAYEYYRSYSELEQHFRADHFLCDHPVCLERKFVVQATAMEADMHAMEAHPEMYRQRGRRVAKPSLTSHLDISYSRGRSGVAASDQSDDRHDTLSSDLQDASAFPSLSADAIAAAAESDAPTGVSGSRQFGGSWGGIEAQQRSQDQFPALGGEGSQKQQQQIVSQTTSTSRRVGNQDRLRQMQEKWGVSNGGPAPSRRTSSASAADAFPSLGGNSSTGSGSRPISLATTQWAQHVQATQSHVANNSNRIVPTPSQPQFESAEAFPSLPSSAPAGSSSAPSSGWRPPSESGGWGAVRETSVVGNGRKKRGKNRGLVLQWYG